MYENEEEEEFNVERLVNRRLNQETGTLEYEVKWLDYSESENTWEPIEHLKCPDLIAAFDAEYEQRRKSTKTQNKRSASDAGNEDKIKIRKGLLKEDIPKPIPSSPSGSDTSLSETLSSASSNTSISSLSLLEGEFDDGRRKSSKPKKQPKTLEASNSISKATPQNGASASTSSSQHSQAATNTSKVNTKVNGNTKLTQSPPKKGFKRGLPLKKIVGACTNEEDNDKKIFFFVKWKGCDELELVDISELEKHEPQRLCSWYKQRLYHDIACLDNTENAE